MTLNVQNKQPEATSELSAIQQVGAQRVRELCGAMKLAEHAEEAAAVFGRLLEAADAKSIDSTSGVGDGFAGCELSLVSGAVPELRLMVRVKGGAGEITALLERVDPSRKLELSRFKQIQDLFFPENSRAASTARVSVAFSAGHAPTFEVYLDPSVSGRTLAPLLIERALVRFGFSSGWPVIGQRLTVRGPDTDELKYVALDLSSPAPRLKVYARHLQSNVAVLDAALGAGLDYQTGDVHKFLRALDLAATPLDGLAPLSCYEFSNGSGSRPNSVSVEIPICGYAEHDATIEKNVTACLAAYGIEQDNYTRALAVMWDGPLQSGLGLHSYVACGRDAHGTPTVTVRLPFHSGRRHQVANSDAVAAPSGVMEVVDRYEQWDQITNHPFLHRLRSEPVNLFHIWCVLANFQASISKTFSQRLALIASRVDDPHTRHIVTDLLYDEMGSGNYDLAHVNLFSNMMKVMEPWKPKLVDDWALGAGHQFNVAMDETYGNADVNVALGAIVSGEIFGKQFDQFLGDEIRRQNEVDPALFVWVTLHESLEVTHAGEGADIARLVPAAGFEAMSRGAYGLALGAWRFLTDVYEICYGERPAT
jgi:Iron-containing redox enzyme